MALTENSAKVKNLRGVLSAIAYMDLSHLSLSEQIATFKKWAHMGLDGIGITGEMPDRS